MPAGKTARGIVEPEASSRAPRFALRFAILTALGLALGGAAILLFVRHDEIARSEQSVRFQAEFVSRSVLAGELRRSDLSAPIDAGRRQQLAAFFRRHVVLGATIGAAVYGPGGRLAYSNLGTAVHSSGNEARVLAAIEGTSSTEVTSIRDRTGADIRVLESFVPVAAGGGPNGALVLYEDYSPIASAAWHAFLPVAGVLEAVLLALYLMLLPLLRRTSARLSRQMEEIKRLALRDALTELPNRTLFRQRVEEAVEAHDDETGGIAVFLLDLDHFKEINDTLGHESGDELLRAVAGRLKSLVRDGDTVARLGGDEFAVLCRVAKGREEALLVSERLRRGLDQPFAVAGMMLEVEASVGIALHPEHGDDVDGLMRHADIAMYRAKETQAAEIYCSETDHYSTQRLALTSELRQTIADDQLLIHYQPRVDMKTGELRKVEALVRWNHPQRGLLSTADFLPLAERSGLARSLTRRMLEGSLRDCRAWMDAGHAIGISVNLFGRDLLDLGLPSQISDLLVEFDLDPRLLEVEITENTILTDPKRSNAILSRLTRHGIRVAIDDFGTGYSSLSHLSRLPVDVIKIDKSFVQRMADERDAELIVRSTVDLAHNLGLEAIAEGVESKELWDRLTELGCDTAQGFYISRPIPAGLVLDWLALWRTKHEAPTEETRAVRALSVAG